MNNTILSICIPTYNRAEHLKKTLETIIFQFKNEDIYKQVEIVISDNASEDNTAGIIKEFQRRFANIKYFRNDKNVGFDRNLYNTIIRSNGEFCWTLNDDKLLKSYALSYLLKTLKDNKDVGFFCIDQFFSFDNGLEKKFKDGNEWLKEMGLVGGRLAQCIINKQYFSQDSEKYFDNYWFHLSVALEIIKNKTAMLIKNILEPDKEDRFCRWAENGQTLFTFIELKKIISNLIIFGYEKKIIKKINFQIAQDLPRQMITAKIHGLKVNFKNIKILFLNFYKYPFYLFLATILFFIPSFVFKFIKLLWKRKLV